MKTSRTKKNHRAEAQFRIRKSKKPVESTESHFEMPFSLSNRDLEIDSTGKNPVESIDSDSFGGHQLRNFLEEASQIKIFRALPISPPNHRKLFQWREAFPLVGRDCCLWRTIWRPSPSSGARMLAAGAVCAWRVLERVPALVRSCHPPAGLSQ